MAIQKFIKVTTTGVALPIENVDTDQIIPARFLKAVERKGFGDNLFRDWRYDAQGNPVKDFPLNNSKGEILVAGKNFGSGSSREHAAWAICDYGFRAVISSFFADIFRNNALNVGVLPVQVSEQFLAKTFEAIKNNPQTQVEIDLPAQTVSVEGVGSEPFRLDPYKKECLMSGYDDVDYLVAMRDQITDYENRRNP